jgi:hypothetical protein
MTILVHDDDGAFELEQRDDALVMIVLCGSIALYEVVFRLNPTETAAYESGGLAYLRELANDVRRNDSHYRARVGAP